MVFINNKLKAIYLHNVKCGGCYMRNILETYYGFAEPHMSLHNKYAEFFENPNDIRLNEDTDKHTIRKMGKYRYFYSHQDLNKELFDTYFIFIFVRNPYDKIYSAYLYLVLRLQESNYTKIRGTTENPDYFVDFNTFIKNYKNVNNISYYHAFIKQYEHLLDYSNNIKIQYIGSVENLDNEFINILNILNIKEILHNKNLFYNKRKNVSNTSNKNITDEFNEETFHFVNEYFEKDFEVFGYKKYDSWEEFKNMHNNTNNNNNSNLPSNQLNQSYKDTSINIYNNLIQENLFLKYENIINNLLDGITSYTNYNTKNELKTMNTEIQHLYKEKDELILKNKNTNKNIIDNLFELNKNTHTQIKCIQCGFIAFNNLAYKAHDYFCNKC